MVLYADGPTVDVDVVIDASAETVWRLVTDIDLPAWFSDEFLGADWIDGATGPQVGARFVGRNQHPASGAWQTTSVVVRCDEPLVFAWAVGSPDQPSATWRFELEPDGTRTRLRQVATMGPGPSGLTPAIKAMPDKEERIVARRMEEWRTNMQTTVDGIKTLAEDPAAR